VAYSFSASRFIVTVDFTDKSRLGTLVRISSKEGEPELTLEEAPQIMMSLGLNNPQKIAKIRLPKIRMSSSSPRTMSDRK
jgi:hypothetical protein